MIGNCPLSEYFTMSKEIDGSISSINSISIQYVEIYQCEAPGDMNAKDLPELVVYPLYSSLLPG